MILLLLQLAVILLDFPVGFFYVVIHELVHDWHLIKEEGPEPWGQGSCPGQRNPWTGGIGDTEVVSAQPAQKVTDWLFLYTGSTTAVKNVTGVDTGPFMSSKN